MAIKTWIWSFFIVTIVGSIVFFFINFFYYAGVMDLNIFIMVIMQLILGIFAVIKKEKRFIYAGLIIMLYSIVVFAIGVQRFTYAEAQKSVMNNYEEDGINLLSLDHKTAPINESPWYLSNKAYYIAVKKDDEEAEYYAVDPVQGKPVKLEEPYWSDHSS